jgi:hypothetical protein
MGAGNGDPNEKWIDTPALASGVRAVNTPRAARPIMKDVFITERSDGVPVAGLH